MVFLTLTIYYHWIIFTDIFKKVVKKKVKIFYYCYHYHYYYYMGNFVVLVL